MAASVTLERLVGRRLVFGLPGPDLSDADVRLFRETGAGGLILYRRNFETPEGLHRLLASLESALGRRLLVTTDHEGGRIIMLNQGVTIFPDNLAAGTAGDPALVRRQGEIEGRELRRLGVDVTFGPVLDVLTERYSPNIGIRAYGRDPGLVSACGVARIQGLQAAGASACAKHFPGKGHTPVDAHLGLPVIDSDWPEMRTRHLVPFLAAIEAGVDCVMTSHPLYPRLDPTPATPVTFSRRLVAEYLRGELGYGGVIVSDDLEMGAISALCPVGEATVRAAAAGHDLLLVCHTEPAQRAAHAALLAAYRQGTLPADELEQSVNRLDRLAERRAARFAGGALAPEPEGEALARDLARRAARVVAFPAASFVQPPGGSILAVFPQLSALADRITVEPVMQDEAGYVRGVLGRHGVEPEVEVVGVEPTDAEIERVAARARSAGATVLFLYDAHLYASNRRLLDALQAGAPALAVVLMRDPYDAALLAPGVRAVTAFGWRRCQLDAAVDRLFD